MRLSLKQETLKRFFAQVRPYLVSLAKAGNTIPYGALGSEFRLSRQNIGEITGAISEAEHQEGHPRLSAIVVAKATGLPGSGFFGLSGVPSELRWQGQGERVTCEVAEGRKRFARLQQARVFYYWWEHRTES